MKLSVSLTQEDVALLDAHARRLGLRSRSAALREAIGLLRDVDLEEQYAAAWREWDVSGDNQAWDDLSGDGLTDATG